MDTKYLSYFLEIAKRKNLSRAATYLFVTQSTLSQYLAKEEAELGVKLFIRDKNEMKLTYAGELYKKACEEMLETKNRLYRDLADLEQSRTGFAKVGITPQWGGVIISKVLPEYLEKYPYNQIRIVEDTAHPLMEALSANTLDFALVALNEKVPSQLPNELIYKEELVLAVPRMWKVLPEAETPDGETPMVTLDIFKEYPFSKERTVIRDITNEMFRSANFIPHVIFEINNHTGQLEMVARNMGITIIPKSYMRESPDICYYSVAPGWYWDISIVMRRDYELSLANRHLICLIQKYFVDKEGEMVN